VNDDAVVTYDEAARWLPTDVREHIETTAPCIGGGEHNWRHSSVDIQVAERLSPVRTIESWSCARPGCNLTVNVEPKAVEA
jgi:hypothetical protein